jgi:hypothetical protein
MTAVKKKDTSARPIDPLYVIFEQHLFNFADPDSDRKSFITGVVNDYLTYLRKHNVIVPKSLEQPIHDELGAQVNTMLVKKIYGCLNIQDYQDTIPQLTKRRARARYSKIAPQRRSRSTRGASAKKSG